MHVTGKDVSYIIIQIHYSLVTACGCGKKYCICVLFPVL